MQETLATVATVATGNESIPLTSATARLEPELVELLREISPNIRRASMAWRRGEDRLEVAYLVFGTRRATSQELESLLVVCRTDPQTPPAWAFPVRPSHFLQDGHLTDTLAWIDRWCDPEDLPGAKRLLAARYNRDFAHSMREHQRSGRVDAKRIDL